MSWFNIYSLWRQPIPKNLGTSEKYLLYSRPNTCSDDFPLYWATVISESPSGSSCLSTVQDFLEGQKFSDDELGKIIVNPRGETLWQIHQQTADSFGEFEGFYWLCRYNALGDKITEIEFLPFQNCRLGKPDDNGYVSKIYYNPFFGTKEYAGENKKLTKVYDVFNPKAVKSQILEQKSKFKGQVFFYGNTTPLSPYYPMPEPFSCLEWMKIEPGVSDYHEDNLNNGFLQPFMLIMKGNPGDPSTNPEYQDYNDGKPMTVAQEFDKVVGENFMGAKRVGNMFVQWVNQGEEAPTVLTLPANNNGDLFITLDNQATKKITVSWKVPSILANINEGVSLGGDGNQVRVAVKLMQQRSIKKQKILTDSYEKVMKLFVQPYNEEIKIVPYNPYPELELLDQKIWDTLTTDEKRLWIEEHTDVKLIEAEPEVVDPTQEQPVQQPSNFVNSIPVSFPDNVKNKVKKTLEYIDKMQIKCGGQGGRDVANAILNNNSMGFKQLKRIKNFLKKNEKYTNSQLNEGCDVILYNAWGGKEMADFLDSKINQLDEWLN